MRLSRPRGLVPAAGLAAWCLADLARDPAPRLLPRPVWTAVIVMSPLGGLAWVVLGRSSRRRRR